jgi:hypothetical protein
MKIRRYSAVHTPSWIEIFHVSSEQRTVGIMLLLFTCAQWIKTLSYAPGPMATDMNTEIVSSTATDGGIKATFLDMKVKVRTTIDMISRRASVQCSFEACPCSARALHMSTTPVTLCCVVSVSVCATVHVCRLLRFSEEVCASFAIERIYIGKPHGLL